jgi:transcriptional regulator with XRE-family HTH domain
VGVSTRTLSLWECDKVFPKWKHQPRLAGFLGYDPFEDPLLERPLTNETPYVAFLAAGQPLAFGDEVRNLLLRLRLSRGECARKLDVDPKTLWGWETGKHQPTEEVRQRTLRALRSDLF